MASIMGIINCPECGHEVSDQAGACPSCGHPLTPPPPPPAAEPAPQSRYNAILIGLASGAVVLLVIVLVLMLRGDDGGDEALPAATATQPQVTTGDTSATTEPTPTTSTTEPTPTTSTTEPTPTTSTTEPPPTSATTEPPPTSATTDPPPTTSTTEPPPAPGPCPGVTPPPLGIRVFNRSDIYGDFDGDGSPEVFYVYTADDVSLVWHARVDFANGFAAETTFEANAMHFARAVTATRIGHVGDLAVVSVDLEGGIAGFEPREVYGLFYFDEDDCGLHQATRSDDGTPLAIPVGLRPSISFPTAEYDGLTCSADGIYHTMSRPNPPGSVFGFDVSSVSYTWDSATRTLVPGLQVSVALCCNLPDDQDLIEGSARFGC
ncbi:MAG: zinc ribbon domain-containing protein [Deltaproteobacteria bacterium]|nr:zinc ribbon domain-containing protein [Deltaproteobacteria bacterium]